MKLDGVTSNQFPARELSALFPKFPVPVSANFNGASRDSQPYKVHVNPPESVRLTHNKHSLFEKMALEGYPVPKYHHAPDLLEDDYFCIDNIEELFGLSDTWADSPIHLRDRTNERIITDLDDAFTLAKLFSQEQMVAFQPTITGPEKRIAQISAIPAMVGKACRNGARMTHNGILSGEVYSHIKEDILKTVLEVIEVIGLDYATVVVAYTEESFEFHDIECRLKLEHVPALTHFIELMCEKAKITSKRK